MEEEAVHSDSTADTNGGEDENGDSESAEDLVGGKRNENELVIGEAMIREPHKNMLFSTYEELFAFYKEYAGQMGFAVTKRTSSKGKLGEIKYVTISCSRQGKRVSRSKNPFEPNPTTRINCRARINATVIEDGSWIVTGLELSHNHPLNPSKSPIHLSNSHKSPRACRRARLNDKSGIKIKESMEVDGCTETVLDRDCRNFTDEVQIMRVGDGGANAVQSYSMQGQVIDHCNSSLPPSLSEMVEENVQSYSTTGMKEGENENADSASVENLVDEKGNVNEIAIGEAMIREPSRNMIFDTYDELFGFYKDYANQTGFAVTKRTSSKGKYGEVRYVTISCTRQGKRQSRSKNPFKPNPRINCRARINATFTDDRSWIVTGLELSHNHPLCPRKSRMQLSYNRKALDAHRKIELNDKSENKIKETFNSLSVEDGGCKGLAFLGKECRNYNDKVHWLGIADGGGNVLQSYFTKAQAFDSSFFYAMDFDEENRLRNLFWADGRCRAAYEEFGDVITFDTTYLSEKFNMPFAPFVGANHHGQSALLGCAIISCGDIETFTWLFNTWLTCMSGRAPNAIITSQDIAMENAIGVVFPNARHRWCLWHIMKILPENLTGYKQYEDVKALIQNVVHESLTPDEFESKWTEMIQMYGLEKNSWLMGLYDERNRWVPCFVKDCFWAGMSTTHHNENMNLFFDGYVNSKTTLKQFIEQYENAMRNNVEKESNADWCSSNAQVQFVTRYAIEKQIQQVYTTAKFEEFQEELSGMIYCWLVPLESHATTSKYDVIEDVLVGDNGMRKVKFTVCLIREEGEEYEVKCTCRLYESSGILCRHALVVLISQEIYYLPGKYIVRRWRKDIKRRYTKVKVSYSDWSVTNQGHRFYKMCEAFHEVADLASEFKEKYDEVMDQIQEIKGKESKRKWCF